MGLMTRIFHSFAILMCLMSFNAYGQTQKKDVKKNIEDAKAKVKEADKSIDDAKAKTKDAKKKLEEVEPDIPMVDEDGNPIGASDLPSDLESETKAKNIARPTVEIKHSRYPIEKLYRPLTLLHKMFEVTYDLPVFFDSFSANNILALRYGYSDVLQFGFEYNVGQVDSDGFSFGKAFSLETRYRLKDWISVQAGLPVHIDPLATALTLGVPMQFNFVDAWRFEFGEDLISIKTNGFIPSLESVGANDASAIEDASNTITARALINLSGHVFYQWKRNQVIEGHFGVIRSVDGSSRTPDNPVFLHLGFMHSFSRLFDLRVLVGANRLDDPTETFFVRGQLAKRF